MAKVDSNVEVTIKRARLSFEHVFKAQIPKPDKDGKVGAPTFNCAFLVSKKDGKMLDEIEDAIAECKKKMWGDKPPKIREDRTPYRDGDDYEYDGYEGNMVISARNQRAPSVVHSKKDEDGKFIRLDGSEGVIYSGCYVNGIVRFWAQDSQDYGKRINCSLEVVQFFGDGDAFSGASRVDADDRLKGLEGEVKDDDPRTEGRRRERERDRDADGDDRGSRRGRDEEKDDGRGRTETRRGRDDEGERGSRDRDGGRDRDGRDSGRGRDRDEERGSERSRSSRDDGDRESRRSSRDADDDRGSRGRDRDDRGDDRDRGRDRARDDRREADDRGARSDRGRSSARDDDEAPRRSRDRDDDDRPARSSRDDDRRSSRDRDDDRGGRRNSSRNDDLI